MSTKDVATISLDLAGELSPATGSRSVRCSEYSRGFKDLLTRQDLEENIKKLKLQVIEACC